MLTRITNTINANNIAKLAAVCAEALCVGVYLHNDFFFAVSSGTKFYCVINLLQQIFYDTIMRLSSQYCKIK
jgi:hypothetical protein